MTKYLSANEKAERGRSAHMILNAPAYAEAYNTTMAAIHAELLSIPVGDLRVTALHARMKAHAELNGLLKEWSRDVSSDRDPIND